MAGYSTDEDDSPMGESEYEEERDAALNALVEQDVVEEETYNDLYFGDLELDNFREKMNPESYDFVSIAVAHIQATLTAKGDKIASGLFPHEINEVMRDLSGNWMDLELIATNIFKGDEAIKRNPVNLLHHEWFHSHVELTDSGRYRIRETDVNREVLEMMKEGAKYACAKKQDDDDNRNKENERPENRARFMHGCNFLSSVIKITCDKECLNKVLWQQVQNVFSEMVALYENKCLQSRRNDVSDQQKLELFEVYRKVLKLDEHKRLNGDSMKYITGRRKAKDALCEPLFANIGMHTTDDSGGFTVHILDFDKEYSKEDIDKVLKSNMRPMSRDEKQMSKKYEDLMQKEQERNERKSTYTPKFTSRVNNVIPEIPSTKPKPTPHSKTDWGGANDDFEDSGPSTSGLAPQFAKVINRNIESEKRTISVSPGPEDDQLISDEDDWSSAGEMDGNKDNQYSDDEGGRVRRKKKILKNLSGDRESKQKSNANDNAIQNNRFPTAARHKPFNSNEEYNDDSEPEEEQDESENIIIEEKPIDINNATSVEDIFDGSNFESHQHVTGDLNMLVDRNLPDHLDADRKKTAQPIVINNATSVTEDIIDGTNLDSPQNVSIDLNMLIARNIPDELDVASLPKAYIPMTQIFRNSDKTVQKDMEDHVPLEIQKKHDEQKQIREEEERLKQERQIRKQNEFLEEERIRRLAQEKADEDYAKKVQQELDDLSVRNEQVVVETNKNYNERSEDYSGRKADWSNLGHGKKVPNQNGRVYQNADAGNHRRAPSVNDQQSLLLDSSQLSQDRIKERSRPESLSSNRYMTGPQAANQLQDNGRNTVFASGAQSSYLPSLAGSSYSSVSHNFGRRSGQCDSPYDNGKLSGCPGFMCNVPTKIITTLSDKAIKDENSYPVSDDILQDFHSYPVDLEYHRSLQSDQSTDEHPADSGFKSGQYSNSGPQTTCGSSVNCRIVTNIPATRGSAFRQEYDNRRGVLTDEREMNQSFGSHAHPAVNRQRRVDYCDGRYSNLSRPRTVGNGSYNAVPINRYDVSRPGTSHSFNGSNIDDHGRRFNEDCVYPSLQPSNSLNPQGDDFVKFIKFYMVMFARPAIEIQWSEIVYRCKKIDTTFWYPHPINIFGQSFVDQLLQRLPDYIQVFSLEGSSEVIFAIDECRYRGLGSLGDLRYVFIEFVHSFLPAFNCAIKWNHIVKNNIVFPCLDSVFGTPMGGYWMEEFTELAYQLGLPLRAQKPRSEIYLNILQS